MVCVECGVCGVWCVCVCVECGVRLMYASYVCGVYVVCVLCVMFVEYGIRVVCV